MTTINKNFEKELLNEEPRMPLSMNPLKFAMWLFIVSIIMIFASLTSAYLVRRAEGNWLDFQMPNIFWVSTVVIILSSVTMQWAYISAKKDNLSQISIAMVFTSLLGLTFLVLQWYGWKALKLENVFLAGNPSGSFLYMLTGAHGVHIMAGVLFLFIILAKSLNHTIHSKNTLWIEMCTTFWHFLGLLWIYLFVFLLLNQ